jgi:hypothetical protein
LPRPAPFNFDGQGPAQESADEHEQTEDGDIVQGGLKGDRPDHISRHKKFPPVNFPVIGMMGRGGETNITYWDQWVGCSQSLSPVLPTLAITGKFTGPNIVELRRWSGLSMWLKISH